MLNVFKPTWMLEKIYLLTPEQLEQHNIRAIITDLDNTLIAWNHPDGTPELHEWLKKMKAADIPVIILSNNTNRRVRRVAEQFGIQYHAPALKPSRRGYRYALRKLDMRASEVALVGDQVMTDIFGANRAGIRSILVMPIVENDAIFTKMNRMLEQAIFKKLYANYPELKWRKILE